MKTQYTLLAAKMEEGWVLVNSRLHRPIAKKAIEKGVLGFLPERIEEEITFGKSRFGYRVDDSFVELKGCSLVEKGYCLSPTLWPYAHIVISCCTLREMDSFT